MPSGIPKSGGVFWPDLPSEALLVEGFLAGVDLGRAIIAPFGNAAGTG
jgi:hypothetical protein